MSNNELDVALLQAHLTGAVYRDLGFDTVSNTNLRSCLKRIGPTSTTALRDSLLVGTQMMMELHRVLTAIGTAQHWHFLHIVITDGADVGSLNTLETTGVMMHAIGQVIGSKFLKTVFIGIDVDQDRQAIRELGALVALGREFTDFHCASSTNLDQIFDRIRISVGMQRTTIGIRTENQYFAAQHQRTSVTVSRENYVVLFNCDMSGSMAGGRWARVCSAVDRFLNFMAPTDLVAGLAFNDNVSLITSPRGPVTLPKTNFNRIIDDIVNDRNQERRTSGLRDGTPSRIYASNNNTCQNCYDCLWGVAKIIIVVYVVLIVLGILFQRK